MAKEETVEPRREQEAEPTPPKGRSRFVVLGAIAGVMIAEALIVFVLVKSFGGAGPKAAEAHGPGGLQPDEGLKAPEPVEVEIAQFRATNEKSQRPVGYQITIFVLVSSDKQERFKALMEKRRETVKDRFIRVVRSADPARFQEPDLATLREQFKHELVQVIGEKEAVQEVLIPSITPFSEY